MLNIYYGRESVDKERFMYDSIRNSGGRNLVIVPDQYTLEGEKQAFRFLETQSLIDVEIISMSRLGYKLLAELGGAKENFIDKYGRHMILSRIVRTNEQSIEVFKGTLAKGSFVELVNNFISEMKQYDVTPEALEEMAKTLADNSLLKKKLADLTLIYSLYEDEIQGKYTDSEDYINLYIDKISQSSDIKVSNIWIYGFESFAPKALKLIQQLMVYSPQVNLVLTYDKMCRDEDLFKLAELVIGNMEKAAKEVGCQVKKCRIDDIYRYKDKPEAMKVIESELYATLKRRSKSCSGLTVVKAANMYNEAESAAAYILHLLRDENMKYSDIVVICNDQAVRGSILKRVFNEYGLDFFADKKRGILNSPIVIYIISLLETVAFGFRTPDIFKFLKTGFSGISDKDIEELENYGIKYRIKGSMWKKTFPKGQLEYGTEGLDKINELRESIISIFTPVEKFAGEALTVEEFTGRFYDYISDELKLPEKIGEFIQLQRDENLMDIADETMQIWAKICEILDQIVNLAGSDTFDLEEYIYLLTSGLDQVEVGVLPPTVDDILVGTMQRTRSGPVKAMLVIGVNEGVLPAETLGDELFTREEMDFLAENGDGICKSDKIRNLEEQLAIYRNLVKPSKYLWISFSASDEDGKETRSSEIIDNLQKIFPELVVENDVLNREEPDDLIGGKVSTLRHLTEKLQQARKGEFISPVWEVALQWMQEKYPKEMDEISKGFDYTNKQINLPIAIASELYKKDDAKLLSLSPSRLERFSRCPFAHFVSYGLKPEERRVFQAAGREIGDIYHSCLMELSEMLTKEKRWETITPDECRMYVCSAIRKQTSAYRDGIFDFTNEEKYKTSRIEEACFYVCWSLIEQVRCGKIKSSEYEVSFGRGHSLKPIVVPLSSGTAYIEGKIDRLDILENDRVKIIDYKTGNEKFDIEEAEAGYRLQLMLYLKAAQENVRKPAGVFYFLIGDPRVDVSGMGRQEYIDKISKEIRKSFKLNGIMVSNGTVINQIAGDFEGTSDVVPLKKLKDGTIKGTGDNFLVEEEDFEEIQKIVDFKVLELCQELSDGKIDIVPKKSGDSSLCDFCELKGICRFDLEFSGCHFDKIK